MIGDPHLKKAVDKVAEQIEAVLEKEKSVEYHELRGMFKECDVITYSLAVRQLKNEKRIERVTEGKEVKYTIV